MITLDEREAKSVSNKITTGDVIGLDEVIYVISDKFDRLIESLKEMTFSEPPTVQVITSNQVITQEKVSGLRL